MLVVMSQVTGLYRYYASHQSTSTLCWFARHASDKLCFFSAFVLILPSFRAICMPMLCKHHVAGCWSTSHVAYSAACTVMIVIAIGYGARIMGVEGQLSYLDPRTYLRRTHDRTTNIKARMPALRRALLAPSSHTPPRSGAPPYLQQARREPRRVDARHQGGRSQPAVTTSQLQRRLLTLAQQVAAAAVTVFLDDRLARAAALLVVTLVYLLLGLRNPPYYRAAPNEFRVAAAASCDVASLLG